MKFTSRTCFEVEWTFLRKFFDCWKGSIGWKCILLPDPIRGENLAQDELEFRKRVIIRGSGVKNAVVITYRTLSVPSNLKIFVSYAQHKRIMLKDQKSYLRGQKTGRTCLKTLLE